MTVTLTLKRDTQAAIERYHYYLFDPNGYALRKMKEQLISEGYNSCALPRLFIADRYEESFVAKNGQAPTSAQRNSLKLRSHTVSTQRAIQMQ